ncbi:MAG: hypothetical protein PVI21_06285 [Candidatus Woesebacteria bacterium]|jgi:hypothetical protein
MGTLRKELPVIRMGEILTMAPESDVLNGDVIARLGTAWSEIPAADIAQQGVFGLARNLMVVLPDNGGFSNALRLRVAEELVALLKRFNVEESVPQQTVTTVRVERNFSEMSLRQLLETIVIDPSLYREALRHIKAHPELRNAARKTYKWVVPVNSDGTGIDVDATMQYVLELDKPHAVPQRRVTGHRRPVWLGRAMGANDLPLVHVITGRLTQGPDENGFDWSTRPKELLEAILWARKTRHSQLPDLQSDVYGWSEQLFCDPLPRRFQDILGDYLDAKESRVSTTDGIRADWPEDLPFDSAFTFVVTVKAAAVDYEALVCEAANLVAPLHASGMGTSVRGGVYSTIKVSGMNAYIDGVIVINGGQVSGMSVSGTVYMPPGRSLRVSGMNANVRVINQTWRQLAERLGLV